MAIVMIVEEDPAAADLIVDVLQREGFAVVRAAVPDDEVPEAARRVRAQLRRHRLARPRTLEAGNVSLDTTTRQARRGGHIIELSPREYDLLAHLMRHADQVVHRADLFEAVWHYRHERASNVVEVHVARLRRKLGAPPIIHTVRGLGYVLGVEGAGLKPPGERR
jgi:two-component system OmpR family response regulator